MTNEPEPNIAFLQDGGEMGALMRVHDWSRSPLGNPEAWPQSLRSVVGLMLASRFPMFVAWGKELSFLYNDPYAEILGRKHPDALGTRFNDIWPEIWPDISPLIDAALAGETTCRKNLPLLMNRRGFEEQTWFTFSYSPVRDESGEVVGMFCTCTETTAQVLAEEKIAAERERQRLMLQKMPGFAALLTGPEHRFEYVNDAFVAIAGPRDFAGRSVREVFSELEGRGFHEMLDQVAGTGQPSVARAVPVSLSSDEGQKRYIDFACNPVRNDAGTVTGIFVGGYDVTDIHQAKDELRANAARQSFRLSLEERLRDMVEPDELIATASEMLGRELGAGQAVYAEIDASGEYATINREWNDGSLPSNVGRHHLSDYGAAIIADLKAGRAVTIGDVALDWRTSSPETLVAFARASVAAFVSMPLIKSGRLVAVVSVHNAAPRRWSSGDTELVQEVAERIWGAAERARAEARLRASEEFNRRVLASSADCIKVLDLDARLEFMSEGGMCVMEVDDFGAIKGKCWPDFWLGEEHAKALASVEEARRGGTGRFQGPATTMKGTPRWWDVIVTPINGPDGKPEKLLSISRDVTTAKQAETTLREMNDTLEKRVAEATADVDRIWRNANDIFLVINQDGIVQRVNPAASAILGWCGSDMIGRSIFDFILSEDVPRSVSALEHARENALPTFENRYRTKDGGRRSISWLAVPEADLIYAYGRDVTAERERQTELEAAQEALRQSQKMEAVGQLTGGIAHDFNNLLGGISGSLELMSSRLSQGRLGDMERHITAAQGAARRAASLTHRLLAFSRRQTLDPKVLDVNRLVLEMEELIRRTVGPSISFEVVGASDLWNTLVDASQLENALLNLCINARDAMPEGGRITIETANRWLDARAAKEHDMAAGQYISLCVTDTGTGMPPDVKARAFDPFFTTKPLGEGTGLGLSMIYGFAKQSGGQARIYTEVGHGTTICLYLPRHAGEADVQDAEDYNSASLPLPKSGGRNVLVVDDEPLIRMLMADILDEQGHTVLEAGDGAAGLRVLQADMPIDLLVTDVGLPGGMDGRQLADAARTLRPDLKVLFITGYAENALLRGGQLAPGMQVLTKPFPIDTMAARIQEMMKP